jgi:hypothetical protein
MQLGVVATETSDGHRSLGVVHSVASVTVLHVYRPMGDDLGLVRVVVYVGCRCWVFGKPFALADLRQHDTPDVEYHQLVRVVIEPSGTMEILA